MPVPIRLVVIGKVKEPYLAAGISEYLKRLRPYCKLELIELKDEGIEKEAVRLEKYISNDEGAVFILDVEGAHTDSREFAKLVKSHELSPSPLTFVIGSAQGIDDKIKKKTKLISLSKMTFTHEMCRLFLLEQIYRAFQIAQNRPYHR